MGCFRACFGDSKRRKQRKSGNENHIFRASEANQSLKPTKQEIEKPVNLIADPPKKLEEQIDGYHTTEVAPDPIINDDEVVSSGKIVNDLDGIKEENRGKEDDELIRGESGSNSSNAFSLPLNHSHRYTDCSDSDDEYVEERDHIDEDEEEEEEEEEADGGDGDGDGKIKKLVLEESSESLFSLSFDSRKQICTVEVEEKEVNSPAADTSSADIKPGRDLSVQNAVDSILNPIENITQWNAANVKRTLAPVQHLEKENINLEKDHEVLISPEPTFKRSIRRSKENYCDSKPEEDDIAVDTSLSNWLVESETTPRSKSSTSSIGNSPMGTRNSPKSYEDRPILGALTLEELKQFSAFSTPRRSRSRSPEETPIIGSVGSYWNHTGQDCDSNPGSSCRGVTKTVRKNREDERVNWNSTPFLERLDMALASNSAEV